MLSYTTVIVTFNRKKAIKEALIHQFKQTIQAEKIIIVDNHSTDGTYEYIKDILKKNSHQLEYIRLDENLGGSGGFYYGMKRALKYNTDLIAISDDDASYGEDYFEKIIEAAEQNPQDMAFCGSMYKNGKLHPTTASFLVNENILKFKTAEISNYKDGDFYADNWPFVGPVFRTKLIKKIGLPNKNFFIWYDDSEYAIRMHQLGYRYHVVVNAKIHLNADIKAKRAPLWKKYYGFRNEIYVIRNYGKNKFISKVYPYYMLIKKEMSVLIKKGEFNGRQVEAFKLYLRAFDDAKNNKLGKMINPINSDKY